MLPEIPLQPIEALATRVEPDSDIFNEYEGMDGRVPTAEGKGHHILQRVLCLTSVL